MRVASSTVLAALVALTAVVMPACHTETTPAPTPTPNLSLYALEYRLLDHYPEFFWCDPDFYPIYYEGQEEQHAIDLFPAIRSNTAEFVAILARLMLPDKEDFTPGEKLAIYREHKKLTFIIRMTPTSGGYTFSLSTSEDQGLCVEGNISFQGRINELKREACFITCPICLTRGVFIDTPAGPVPVEEVTTGSAVWTMDESGKRVEARVIATAATHVPRDFEVVTVSLADGRTVTASPGHPTAERRPLGDYRVGEALDGTPVASIERVRCEGGFTYDLLPAGPTGMYWANRVLLESTLMEEAHGGSRIPIAAAH